MTLLVCGTKNHKISIKSKWKGFFFFPEINSDVVLYMCLNVSYYFQFGILILQVKWEDKSLLYH